MIAVPLSTSQRALYRQSKEAGASDEEIYAQLFPTPKQQRPPSIPLQQLTKAQTIEVLTQRLGQPLRGLARLSHAELQTLVRALYGAQRVNITI